MSEGCFFVCSVSSSTRFEIIEIILIHSFGINEGSNSLWQCMNAGMRQEQKTNAILSFDGSPPDVFFHFSSGISVDVSLSRFHQTTLSLLSLVEPALTSLDLMCTVGQGEESRMHVKLICNFCEE